MEKIEDLIVKEKTPLKRAMEKMGVAGLGIVMVVDELQKLKGTLTDGDVRRALMNGTDVQANVSLVMQKNPLTAKTAMTFEEILDTVRRDARTFPDHYVLKIPLLDGEGRVVDIFIKSINSGFRYLREKNLRIQPVKKVLVVGGAGYIGSVLSKKLLARGYKVVVLDKLVFGKKPIAEFVGKPNFKLVYGDMRNIEVLTSSLEGVDAVILLAGIVGDPAGSTIPQETIETNYFATLMLAQICKYYQINRFMFASTCSVYGVNSELVTEEDILNPQSLYARSKIDSERSILALQDTNFSPTVLRMSTVFGLSPRMRFDLVVNIFAMRAALGQEISIFGGEQWRPFIHVADAAEAYVKCLEAPIQKIAGEIFNVGHDNHTINQLGDYVKEIFRSPLIRKTEEEVIKGALDSRNYKVSFDKAQRVLNFTAEKSVRAAILEIKEFIESGKIADPGADIYYNIEMAKLSSL